jgi:hypothetical protein
MLKTPSGDKFLKNTVNTFSDAMANLVVKKVYSPFKPRTFN